jgi:hypothetical protein
MLNPALYGGEGSIVWCSGFREGEAYVNLIGEWVKFRTCLVSLERRQSLAATRHRMNSSW